MMCVDVDVGDSPQAVFFSQMLYRDSAIIENAKARGMTASRVMQPGDWHEHTFRIAERVVAIRAKQAE